MTHGPWRWPRIRVLFLSIAEVWLILALLGALCWGLDRYLHDRASRREFYISHGYCEKVANLGDGKFRYQWEKC